MGQRRHRGWKRDRAATSVRSSVLRFAFVVALSAIPEHALAAQREYLLRFLPPEGAPVDGYQVHLAPVGAPFGEPRDIGFVAPDAEGISSTTLLLDSATAYQIGMTAYNAGGESGLSNLIIVDALACDPTLCSDGNDCTADACELAGCSHVALADGTACEDGFVDTVDDRCDAGECVGLVLECTDSLGCDDQDVCNGIETCGSDGMCWTGAPLDCGQPTACEVPLCDPEEGCLRVPRPDGAPCDDGLRSTRHDRCLAGACVGELRGHRQSREKR